MVSASAFGTKYALCTGVSNQGKENRNNTSTADKHRQRSENAAAAETEWSKQ